MTVGVPCHAGFRLSNRLTGVDDFSRQVATGAWIDPSEGLLNQAQIGTVFVQLSKLSVACVRALRIQRARGVMTLASGADAQARRRCKLATLVHVISANLMKVALFFFCHCILCLSSIDIDHVF